MAKRKEHKVVQDQSHSQDQSQGDDDIAMAEDKGGGEDSSKTATAHEVAERKSLKARGARRTDIPTSTRSMWSAWGDGVIYKEVGNEEDAPPSSQPRPESESEGERGSEDDLAQAEIDDEDMADSEMVVEDDGQDGSSPSLQPTPSILPPTKKMNRRERRKAAAGESLSNSQHAISTSTTSDSTETPTTTPPVVATKVKLVPSTQWYENDDTEAEIVAAEDGGKTMDKSAPIHYTQKPKVKKKRKDRKERAASKAATQKVQGPTTSAYFSKLPPLHTFQTVSAKSMKEVQSREQRHADALRRTAETLAKAAEEGRGLNPDEIREMAMWAKEALVGVTGAAVEGDTSTKQANDTNTRGPGGETEKRASQGESTESQPAGSKKRKRNRQPREPYEGSKKQRVDSAVGVDGQPPKTKKQKKAEAAKAREEQRLAFLERQQKKREKSFLKKQAKVDVDGEGDVTTRNGPAGDEVAVLNTEAQGEEIPDSYESPQDGKNLLSAQVASELVKSDTSVQTITRSMQKGRYSNRRRSKIAKGQAKAPQVPAVGVPAKLEVAAETPQPVQPKAKRNRVRKTKAQYEDAAMAESASVEAVAQSKDEPTKLLEATSSIEPVVTERRNEVRSSESQHENTAIVESAPVAQAPQVSAEASVPIVPPLGSTRTRSRKRKSKSEEAPIPKPAPAVTAVVEIPSAFQAAEIEPPPTRKRRRNKNKLPDSEMSQPALGELTNTNSSQIKNVPSSALKQSSKDTGVQASKGIHS